VLTQYLGTDFRNFYRSYGIGIFGARFRK